MFKSIFETSRLIIRVPIISDLKYYIEMANKYDYIKESGFAYKHKKQIHDWFSKTLKNDKNINSKVHQVVFSIEAKHSNRVIGAIGYNYELRLKNYSVSYFIDEEYQNMGFATESLIALSNYYYQYKNIKFITIIKDSNIKSIKVAKKSNYIFKKFLYNYFKDIEPNNYLLFEFKGIVKQIV